MKNLIFGFVFMVFANSVFAAATTFLGPIQSGTHAQGANANVATGDGDIYAYDDMECDGDLNVAGSVTAGDMSITGSIDVDGAHNGSISSVVNLDTSTALTITDKYMLIIGSNTSGAFAMTSNASAFISTTTATAGDEVYLVGTSDTGTVTLTDGIGCIELDGSSVTLGKYDNLRLFYYDGKWIMSGGINDID